MSLSSFRQVSHHKLYQDYKKHGSTVVLEASGGDEIGAGYTGFIWPFYLDQIKKMVTMSLEKFIVEFKY